MTILVKALVVLLAAVPTVIAITLHEAAHGYAALAMGDDTARKAGRVSLNPLRHIDPMGTLLLPAVLLLGQWLTMGRVAFMFGWAKPVPISAWNFKRPRQAMMVVAAAGPGMNFLLAWLGALGLHLVGHLPPTVAVITLVFLQYLILANLTLGLFNLLPIPPMDGSRILSGILPASLAALYARLERHGLLLVLLLFFVLPTVLRQAGVTFDPLRAILGWAMPVALRLIMNWAGWGADPAFAHDF